VSLPTPGDLEEVATARAKRLGQDVRRRSRLRTT
jgi:hypothetical protein